MMHVIDRAHAGIVECEPNQTAPLKTPEDFAADVSVDHASQMRFVAECVWQRERLGCRESVVDRAKINAGDVQNPEAREIDGVRLAAELAGRIKAKGDAPLRLALDFGAHPANRLTGG